MTYFVAFDGTALSFAALRRAAAYADALDVSLRVVTVLPVGDAEYARERGWLDEGESFDADTVRARLDREVASVAPDAEFELLTVDRFAPEGAIANRVRKAARDADASVVFLGSENAGHVVSGVSSVGQRVAAGEERYDIHIVRHEVEEGAIAERADT